jgi:tetratricopeptide (TPR) repeat protein
MSAENPRPDDFEALEAWLKERPDDSRAFLKLGMLHQREGRSVQASHAFERAGTLLCQDGLPLRAIEAFEQALAADEQRPRLLISLAAAHLAVGFRDRSIRALKRSCDAALRVGDAQALRDALDHLCGLDEAAAARWIQRHSAS